MTHIRVCHWAACAFATVIGCAILTACTQRGLDAYWQVEQANEGFDRFVEDEPAVRTALARSLQWLESDESIDAYPVRGITREHVSLTLHVLLAALDAREAALRDAILSDLVVLASTSAGGDEASSLITGYYAPEFGGSRVRSAHFRYPLYRLPDDDHQHAARDAIERENLLAGLELCWLADPFDAYVAHVNGSVRVRLPDDSHINLGHIATNKRPYTSLGRLLIDAGEIPAEDISLDAIREHFVKHPGQFESYAHRNERYVFFEELPDDRWPRGSTGIALVPGCSVAVDPTFNPPAAALLLMTTLSEQEDEPLMRLVAAHDTGGAITGPQRADLFFGIGDEAGALAGAQVAGGSLKVLLLRADRLDAWRARTRVRVR